LQMRLAHGRKSGKPFVMLICPADGRHIRAFINDKEFVSKVVTVLEAKIAAPYGNHQVTTKDPLQN
jgi:hypothetical protein